jgi:hypothetical protein
MKKLIFSIVCSIFLFSSCASYQTISAPETISKTIVVKSNHNSTFIKANEWMVQTFGNAESVIQFSDKEAGIVKGKYVMFKGVSATKYTAAQEAYFAMITLRVKDKGARIEVTPLADFKVLKMMGATSGFTPEMFTASANILIAEFEKHMNNKSANDSW